MNYRIISIVGKAGAGKTWLIERLLPELLGRGVRVGTVKHDVHGFEMDHPGKDTYRHFAAGALCVLISGPGKIAFQKRVETSMSLDQAADQYLSDLDLIIAEGYKSGDKPKIEVFRKAVHSKMLCGPGDNLIAVVSDDSPAVAVPVFGLSDVGKVADYIIGLLKADRELNCTCWWRKPCRKEIAGRLRITGEDRGKRIHMTNPSAPRRWRTG